MRRCTPHKQRKQKQRQREIARRRVVEGKRRRYREEYPQFVFVGEQDAEVGFVVRVKKACREVDLSDRSVFGRWEQAVFKLGKRAGLLANVLVEKAMSGDVVAQAQWSCKLGEVIYGHIPRHELRRWIPYNDALIRHIGDRIEVGFRSLRRVSGAGGTIYYSRHEPTVAYDGQERIVGFSGHAIERVCERLVGRWDSYAGAGDAFAFFDQCQRFDTCVLPSGQPAFSFYNECAPGFSSHEYVEQIIGPDRNGGHYYYRVGYCPVSLEGRFAKATTLLLPGYSGTPEFDLLLRSGLPYHERRTLVEKAKRMDDLLRAGDLSLIRRFHHWGLPQVILSPTPLYYPAA